MFGSEAYELEPLEDLDEQDLFLSVLYHDARGGHAIRMLLGEREGSKPYVRHYASKDYAKVGYRSGKYDAYVTVNTFRAYERKSEEAYNLSGIFIDLDGHDFKTFDQMDAAIERTKERLRKAYQEGELTAPTMITHTGRGLGLFYILSSSIANVPKARKSIQYLEQVRAALTAKYKRVLSGRGYLQVDSTVKDRARVCRLPLTYNSKASRWCRLIHVSRDEDGEVRYCDLNRLAEENHLFDQINVLKKQISSRKVVQLDAYRLPFLTIRMQKLQMLQEMRGYDCSGCREYLVFAFYNAAKQVYGENMGKVVLREFNAKFNNPLTDQELDHACKTVDDNVAKTGDYEGFYKLPDSWIVAVLGVTDEENARIRFGSYKRQIEREKAREDNAKAKQERNAAIVKEIREHPDKTYRQIAEIYGVSAKTVQRIAADYDATRYKRQEKQEKAGIVAFVPDNGTNGQKVAESPLGVLSVAVRKGETMPSGVDVELRETRERRQDGLIQAYADLYAQVTERRKRRKQISGQLGFRFDDTGQALYYETS